MRRHVAAILAADVVGYSSLMGEDDIETLRELSMFQNERLAPAVQTNDGRIVKSMGDGWLIEFPSATDAIECAVDIQTTLTAHPRLKLRIGVHVGDVVLQDQDIYGDGINVAARLETLSAPGGILVSEPAWRSLSKVNQDGFRDVGTTSLKNIKGVFRLYGWGPSRALTFASPGSQPIGLAEMPSIAILPFDDLSRDAAHGFLADGITENLIAVLSTSPNLLVIARNSSFVFKGKSLSIHEVAQHLGVRYVVEGSLQAHGDRLRVTAQLIDAVTDTHLWADRFDRRIDDIFELQDDIAHKICVELHVKLTYGETVRHRCPDVESLKLFTTGRTAFNEFTPRGYDTAREMWTRFFEKNPDNPEGLTLMGWLAWHRVYLGISKDRAADLEEAKSYGERALGFDANFGNAHRLLGITAMLRRDFDIANANFDRAMELNPSDGEAMSISGVCRLYSSRFAEAEELLLLSLKLEPFTPTWVPFVLAIARLMLGKYDLARLGFEAIARGKEETHIQMALTWLIILSQLEDQTDQTASAVQNLTSRFPSASISWIETLSLYLFQDTGISEKFRKLLLDAGLKEA